MKLVILDRDGTINAAGDGFIPSADDWRPLPGALEAIARLNHAGVQVVVACDQSGLGRGLFDVAALNAMHGKMHKLLTMAGGRVEAVFFCPHGPEDVCNCRLPQTGLFEQIGERYGLDLPDVRVCSSNPLHLQAGAAAGCEPHLLRPAPAADLATDRADQADLAEPAGEASLPQALPPGTRIHADLGAFADWVIERDALAAAAANLQAGTRHVP